MRISNFRLAIIITHPIQYYAPVFMGLAQEDSLKLKVFYTWGTSVLENKFDPDFGRNIQWDIPLLEGYDYHFTKNISKNPSSAYFKGIVTPNLNHEVEEFDPNAILVYGYAYQGHLNLMRYFNGKKPIWFRGDSTLLDDTKGWKKYLKQLYLNWVFRFINKALYVGQNNKQYFLKYGLSKKQLVFVPHSIDNTRFARERLLEVEEFRRQLGLISSDILILYAGKFEDKKNPMILLDSILNLDASNVHLLFVGNGILETELKTRAETFEIKRLQFNQQEAHLGKRIHFIDFQNQSIMPVIYQACDLFCLPSKGPGETWGLAVNEAMAAGKAVLVSDKVGCAIDLVKGGINGMTFKSGDLIDLTDKLKVLTMSKAILTAMGKESAERIKRWSLEKQVSQIKNLIHD